MKIYIENDNGSRIEVKEIEGVNDCDVLLLQMCVLMRKEDKEILEIELTKKIGKKCVILDMHIEKVLGV